ncbi:hypothetical protein [Palleniella muris]|nr:hypothetical protein [Palleniella muris]
MFSKVEICKLCSTNCRVSGDGGSFAFAFYQQALCMRTASAVTIQ